MLIKNEVVGFVLSTFLFLFFIIAIVKLWKTCVIYLLAGASFG